MIILTAAIAFLALCSVAVGFLQYFGGGEQTQKLIDAADKQAAAAQSFATTADQIRSQIGQAESDFSQTAGKMQTTINNAEQDFRTMAASSQVSIQATQDAMRLDQRAWVVVSHTDGTPELGKPWLLKTFFVNTGKTPARNVMMSCNVAVERNESLVDFGKKAADMRPFLIAPNDPNTYCVLNPLAVPTVTQPVLDALSDPTQNFFTYGFANYDDVFGKKHWLTFCRVLDPGGTSWFGCETHNDTGEGTYPNKTTRIKIQSR
jgi:hypothetical protein